MVAIGSAVDTYIAYKILNTLAQDWEKLPAYKHGIIDKKGKPLKKSWELGTAAERNAYTPLDRLVFNIKRLLNSVPSTARKIGTVATAMWMLRESIELEEDQYQLIERVLLGEAEIPTNVSAGGLNIAGLDNEPPVRRKLRKPDDSFAGDPVFEVDPKTFQAWNKMTFGRAIKNQKLQEEAINSILEYAQVYPSQGIIIRDATTQNMKFLDYSNRIL